MVSIEEKFKAAVEIIENLPKDGTFQPSEELALKFYAFYKQATEGPCLEPRPSFWDFSNKAKWEAWKKNGDMTKEEAMTRYVEELIPLIETMSYNDSIGKFMSLISSYYDNDEDIDNSILRVSSSDEFSESYDYLCELNSNLLDVDLLNQMTSQEMGNFEYNRNDHLSITVLNVQHALDQVLERCNKLEDLILETKGEVIPILNLSYGATLLILLWPFAAHLIIYLLIRSKSRYI